MIKKEEFFQSIFMFLVRKGLISLDEAQEVNQMLQSNDKSNYLNDVA